MSESLAAAGRSQALPGRLRAGKREAILAGALTVFAREGYVRASIDSIAAEAAVSTRTIYNHFADKSALFAAVITDSAAQVAVREIALIERHLDADDAEGDIEAALLSFALAWLPYREQPNPHQSLVRQLSVEAEHIGRDVALAWWQAGPARVRAELAARLSGWHERGLLDVDDAERGAVHFGQLISASPGLAHGRRTPDEHDEWLAAGVRAFLHGYRS